MYGLYRAWFGGGAAGTSNYPCLQDTFSPPDTVVRVGNEGEHQFVAHKGVLAAHSGYLKALLTSAAATTTMTIPSFSGGNGNSGSSSSDTAGGNGGSAGGSSTFVDPACATVAAVTIGQSQRSQPVTSVSVSSVGGEAFAPLLNYMYTGRLEVTLDNVYSVLLATHLLHMPGALEQCRAALLRLRAPPPLPTPIPVPTSATTTTTSPPGSGNILRPIPSRLLVGPPLCWPPTTPLYPPPSASTSTSASVAMSHLPQMPASMLMQPTSVPSAAGINIVMPNVREKREEQCAHYSAREVSKSPQQVSPTHARHRKRQPSSCRSRTPEIVPTVALPFVAAAAAAFTAFAVTSGATDSTRASSPSRSISPTSSSVSRTHSPTIPRHRSSNNKPIIRDERERLAEVVPSDQRRESTSGEDAAGSRNINHVNSNKTNTSNVGGDNNTSGDTVLEHNRSRSSRRRARTGTNNAETSSTSSSTVFSVVYDIACCDGPVRFHRVLNENYSTTSYGVPGAQSRANLQRNCQMEGEDLFNENDENGGPEATTTARGSLAARSPTDSSNDSSNGASTGNCYTCGYCKHTFKSQYCYRKHAKRHLLPTRINETTTTEGANGSSRQDVARASRREVRLLDLNVQYYPCKICGCKFPSYYFVHKHRKLCHANDEERQGAVDPVNPIETNRGGNAEASRSPIHDTP